MLKYITYFVLSDSLFIVLVLSKQSIDKKLNSYQRDLMDKKFALQMREEKIEADLQGMAVKPKTKQHFRISLNTSFRDCSECCGSNIIGCYSPAAGEHCERPLEIGKDIFRTKYLFNNRIKQTLLRTEERVYR